MTQELIEEKKKKKLLNLDTSQLERKEKDQQALDRIYVEKLSNVEKKKKDLIAEYASQTLALGHIIKSKICQHIIEKLSEIVTPDYVRKCLPQNLKDADQAMIAAKKRGKDFRQELRQRDKKSVSEDEEDEETEEEDEETEIKGVENTTRESNINYSDFFEIVYNGTKYKIDIEKLKDYPRDALAEMIKHLIGVVEFHKGELEQSLKQVEDLRATVKRIQSNYEAAQLTIKRFEAKEKETKK